MSATFFELPGIYLPPQASADEIAYRQQLLEHAKAFRARLDELYPAIRDRLPLRRGVHRELLDNHRDTPREVVLLALAQVVYSARYLAAMHASSPRHTLDGKPTKGQHVTSMEARAAAQLLVGYSAERGAEDEFFVTPLDSDEPGPAAADEPHPARPARVRQRSPKTLPAAATKTEAFGKAQTRVPKVTLPITDFEQLLKIDAQGRSGVILSMKLPCGTEVAARLNPKSFRKAVEAFRACEGRASVMVSGELDVSRLELNSAGIAVFPQKAG